MLFNLPLLYAAVAIEEDRVNYDAVMRTFKSLLTLEGQRHRGISLVMPVGNSFPFN